MLGWMKHKLESRLPGKNINNLRYADDITLMTKSEELKTFLINVKEEKEKAGLKLNIQKTKIMASSSITSWQIDGETVGTVSDFIFLGSKITADSDCSHVQVQCKILDAWGWCTGTTRRDGMGREDGGGFRRGSTCIPVMDSF